MKLKCFGLALVALTMTLSGCGGTVLGLNGDIVVHIKRTDGSQDMRNYEVFITKDGDTSLDTANTEDFASTANHPSWCDNWSADATTSELTLNFTTRSDQTPYYVWVRVPSTSSAYETLTLRIDVGSLSGNDRNYDLNINQTTRLAGARIERSSASY